MFYDVLASCVFLTLMHGLGFMHPEHVIVTPSHCVGQQAQDSHGKAMGPMDPKTFRDAMKGLRAVDLGGIPCPMPQFENLLDTGPCRA